jgi:histidinol-phosphate aminotransferase
MKNKIFSKIPDYIAGKDINETKKLLGLKKVIKLASNENPYKTPKTLLNIFKKEFKNIYLYPNKDYPELREKLAEKLELNKENIILGNGSDEIIELVFKYLALQSKNFRVMLFFPTFHLYYILAKIYSAKIIKINLPNFEYDIKKIIKEINKKNVDLIVICNPNNPTGTYINEFNLKEILKRMSKKNIILIDEAYYNYVTALDFPNSVEIFKEFSKKTNLIITRTFSKIYGIAGLRLGYAFGNSEIIKILNKLRMPFNVNSIAYKSALFLIDDEKFINKCKIKNYENKLFFYKELDKLNLEYKRSEANFIFIKLPIKAKDAFESLLKFGIIVRPIYGEGLENYIRVTIGKLKEIKKFLRALKKII